MRFIMAHAPRKNINDAKEIIAIPILCRPAFPKASKERWIIMDRDHSNENKNRRFQKTNAPSDPANPITKEGVAAFSVL